MLTSHISRWSLRALVVYTGACVLVVEILATRILAPHFGSSLTTLSSVLGITLGALSIGYYAGGLLGEKHASWSRLGMILLASGFTTIWIWPLSVIALPLLEGQLSVGIGAIIASLLLFLIPCGILGTLSPYVIAIEESLAPGISAGRAAGNIYFWSTLGSIAGSIAAGFLLIPLLGVRMLIGGIGGSLLILGCAVILISARSRKGIWIALPIALLAGAAISIPERSLAIFTTEGVYQRIGVHDMEIGGRKIRVLWQDRNASSGIDLNSEDYAFDYTRAPQVAWTGREPPQTSLVIGAGAFVIPDAIARSSPEAVVDVVDIEPDLEEIATKFFGHVPSERVRSVVADGRVFLRTAGTYDLIVADAYQATYAIPVHLTTKEFFTLAKEHLTESGLFIGNFIGSADTARKAYLPSAMRTFLDVFPEGQFFAMNDPKSKELQNVMFIACKESGRCIDPCSIALQKSLDPILSTLCDRPIDVSASDLSNHTLLTDDYAPVEWLNSM